MALLIPIQAMPLRRQTLSLFSWRLLFHREDGHETTTVGPLYLWVLLLWIQLIVDQKYSEKKSQKVSKENLNLPHVEYYAESPPMKRCVGIPSEAYM